jgi:hypothetical protein
MEKILLNPGKNIGHFNNICKFSCCRRYQIAIKALSSTIKVSGFRPSAHLFARINVAPSGRIYVGFDIGEFRENLWLQSNTETRPEYVVLLPLTLNRHTGALFE